MLIINILQGLMRESLSSTLKSSAIRSIPKILSDDIVRICPYCGGTGYDPLDGGQCDMCAGEGEL